jgi:hypothetical protein
MSKYLSWILQQDREFITEVCGAHIPSAKFKDYNFSTVTLAELQQLDAKYILSQSVTDN